MGSIGVGDGAECSFPLGQGCSCPGTCKCKYAGSITGRDVAHGAAVQHQTKHILGGLEVGCDGNGSTCESVVVSICYCDSTVNRHGRGGDIVAFGELGSISRGSNDGSSISRIIGAIYGDS